MRLARLMMASAVALGLTATPVLARSAEAGAAAKLSVASAKNVRANTATKDSGKLNSITLISIVVLLGLIGGVAALSGEKAPESP